MTLAIDASTPAAVNNTSNVSPSTITTASFTPPANSLLVVIGVGDTVSVGNATTDSVTDNLGSHLTYTQRIRGTQADTPQVGGTITIWTAPVTTSAAMTISYSHADTTSGTQGGDSNLQIFVMTDGSNLPGVGNAVKLAFTSGTLAAVSYNATATGSQGFGGFLDWNASGAPTAFTGNTIVDPGTNVGNMSWGFPRRTSADGTAGISTTVAATTGGTTTSFRVAAVEVIPGSGPVFAGQRVNLSPGPLPPATPYGLGLPRFVMPTFPGGVSGTAEIFATADLTTASTLTAGAVQEQPAAAALTTGSTLGAPAVRQQPAAAALTTASTLTAAAVRAVPAAAALSTVSTLTAAATVIPGAGAALTTHSTLGTGYLRGVASSGGEFGNTHIPGTYDTDYHYDRATSLAYLAGRGHKVLRFAFLWERVQRTLSGALDTGEVARITTYLDDAATAGLRVILDVHNYGRYGGVALGAAGGPTEADLVDFWTRMSTAFGSHAALLGYGLMNEPHDLPGGWTTGSLYQGFESGVGGWQVEGVNTAAVSTVQHQTGAQSLTGTKTISATGNQNIRLNDNSGSLRSLPGPSLSVWVYVPTTSGLSSASAVMQLQDSSFTYITGSTVSVPFDTWTQVTYTPSSALLANCRAIAVQVNGTWTATGTFTVYLDQVEQGTVLTGSDRWHNASQAVVAALRAAGDTNTVLVPGYQWAGIASWTANNGAAGWIADPANNYLYEGHHYWDNDHSGTYAASYATEVASAVSGGWTAGSNPDALTTRSLSELDTWTAWLATVGARGYAGEFGWPQGTADATSWNILAGTWYSHADAASLWATEWATGEWYGTGYALSVYVTDGTGYLAVTTTASPVSEAHLTPGVTVTRFGAAALSTASTLSAAGVRQQPAAAALSTASTLGAAGVVTQPAAAALSTAHTLTAAGSVTGAGAAATLTTASALTAVAVRTQPGTAALTTASALAAAAVREQPAAAALSTASALTATAVRTVPGTAALTTASTLTATGFLVQFPAAALTTASALAAAGFREQFAAAALTSAHTLAAAAVREVPAAAALSTAHTLTATALLTQPAAAALSTASALTAVGFRVQAGTAALTSAHALTAVGAVGQTAFLTTAHALAAAGVVTQPGAAGLTTASALTAAGVVTQPAGAALTTAHALAALAVVGRPGAAALTTASALSAVGARDIAAAAALTTAHALAAAAVREVPAAPTLTTAHALTAAALRTQPGAAPLTTASALSAAGAVTAAGAAALVTAAILTAAGVSSKTGAVSLTTAVTLTVAASISGFGLAGIGRIDRGPGAGTITRGAPPGFIVPTPATGAADRGTPGFTVRAPGAGMAQTVT